MSIELQFGFSPFAGYINFCYNKIINLVFVLGVNRKEKAIAIDNHLLAKLLELTPQDKMVLVV